MSKNALKLVDILALDRTRLANERTLLIAGISLVKVFPEDVTLMILGGSFITLAPLLLSTGIYRAYRFQQRWQTYFNIRPEEA